MPTLSFKQFLIETLKVAAIAIAAFILSTLVLWTLVAAATFEMMPK
jgi:hypothetical protein